MTKLTPETLQRLSDLSEEVGFATEQALSSVHFDAHSKAARKLREERDALLKSLLESLRASR
jgi:hypothetical protein